MSSDLFKQIKRLLEYSGTDVKEVYETADGSILDVTFGRDEVRVYVTPKSVGTFDLLPKEENLTFDY